MMAATKDANKYLAELQALLATGVPGDPGAGSGAFGVTAQDLGNGWRVQNTTVGGTGNANREAVDPIASWARGLGGDETLSPEEFAARYRMLGRFDPENHNDSYSYLVDTKDKNKVVGSAYAYDAPFNFGRDFVLPAAMIWGGGALLGSALGGAGIGAGVGAGAGAGAGEAAALGLDQVAALGGAEAAGAGAGGAASLAADPLTAYLTAGATDASTLGGLGGYAGSIGAAAAPEVLSLAVPGSAALSGGLLSSGAGGSLGAGASDPLSAYLTTGATDASTIGGMGGYAGAVGAGAVPEVLSAAIPGASTNLSMGGLLNGIGGAVKPIADAVGGAGNLAAIAGGLLGASSGGGSATTTQQSKMDPRMDAYIYGSGKGDPQSLLGAAWNQFLQNPSGINPTMQAGLDLQKSALMDPAYSQAYTNMRNIGNGLLGQGIAANPFASGAAQLPQMKAGGAGGLLGDRAQTLIKSGRGLI